MRPGQRTPHELEAAVLRAIMEQDPTLRIDVEGLRVVNRQYTGVGCLTEFVRDDARETTSEILPLDRSVSVPGCDAGLGAMLFLTSGEANCLELFTYDGSWVGRHDGFSIGP
ncbi:MAG: hypothetical protein H6807_01390 [Planctomycetes bacterium]|nr:hypothetical protein [Planctomycetota bacterium]